MAGSGTPEPVQSQLIQPGTNPQTILLRALVALGGSAKETDLIRLVDSAFCCLAN